MHPASRPSILSTSFTRLLKLASHNAYRALRDSTLASPEKVEGQLRKAVGGRKRHARSLASLTCSSCCSGLTMPLKRRAPREGALASLEKVSSSCARPRAQNHLCAPSHAVPLVSAPHSHICLSQLLRSFTRT